VSTEAYPSVSVVIPTLNAERYLEECLTSVRSQDYPQERIEILLIDAGSTDRTIAIAKAAGVDTILENPLKTGEAGKAVGVRSAGGDLVLSIDSDNVLVGTDWLSRMVAPFADPEVVASQANSILYARRDFFITRYHALLGAGDPLAVYLGNYDRYSTLTGTWTGCPYEASPRDGWLRVVLDPQRVPTLGANGFMFRRAAAEHVAAGSQFFDIDFVHELANVGFRTVALVEVPIRHYFCSSVAQFRKKTRRRIDDYFFFKSRGERSYPWTGSRLGQIARFVLSTVTVIPITADALRGYRRKPDPAWLFHVPACWLTLCIYAVGTLRGLLRPRLMDRTAWRQ
jgi:glycosyltransferase involved in cell wall biosynthesis